MEYKLLFYETEISSVVEKLGQQITQDYQDKPLVIVAIADGGLMFAMDLIRTIDLPLEYSTCICKSYCENKSLDKLNIIYFPPKEIIEGKHLVIVDDIKDSGRTLKLLQQFVEENYSPLSIEHCVLIENCAKQSDVTAKYIALQTNGEWVAGYGLDNYNLDRNLPYIVSCID